jgi:hypothetical protein
VQPFTELAFNAAVLITIVKRFYSLGPVSRGVAEQTGLQKSRKRKMFFKKFLDFKKCRSENFGLKKKFFLLLTRLGNKMLSVTKKIYSTSSSLSYSHFPHSFSISSPHPPSISFSLSVLLSPSFSPHFSLRVFLYLSLLLSFFLFRSFCHPLSISLSHFSSFSNSLLCTFFTFLSHNLI